MNNKEDVSIKFEKCPNCAHKNKVPYDIFFVEGKKASAY